MKNLDNLFSTRKGILHIKKNKHLYNYKNFKVKTLILIYKEETQSKTFFSRKNHATEFKKKFGNYEISELSKINFKEWFQEYQRTNSFSDKNLLHIKCQINHFMKWLAKEKIITVNPLDEVKMRVRKTSKKRIILSNSELKVLTSNLYKHSQNYLFPIVYTLIHTGARRNEVLYLKWSDVDFNTGLITFCNTKNGENRSIQISNSLKRLLLDLSLKRTNSDYIFTNSKSLPHNRQTIHRDLKKFKKSFPIDQKDWTFHSLRHSFAYNFLKKEGEMYQLQAILGHKTIGMTVDLYGNLKLQDIENPSPYDF